MKKIAIIGTVGIPPRYGGIETLVHNITKELKKDFLFTVYCSKETYLKYERLRFSDQTRLIYIPFRASSQRFFYDLSSILHSLFYADTLLIFGVTTGILLPFIRFFTKKKIIMNIDKLQWRRNKYGKITNSLLKFSEGIAVKFSHVNVTDNKLIKRYTTIKHKASSLLIECGGDHTIFYGHTKKYLKKYPFLKYAYAFNVAKIVPENNIEMILNAFSITNQHLVLVSNWSNNKYAIRLKKSYQYYSNIHLIDPIYNQEELDGIRRNCVLYIHGNDTQRTSLSLVEAMSLGLPVVTFSTNFNKATTENSAFYFKSVEDLITIISTVKYYNYINNSLKMKEIALRRYSWRLIARKYKDLIYFLCYQHRKRSINVDISSLKETYLQKRGLAHLKNLRAYK